MSSDWILNDEANNRVKDLLRQAGIPLEIQIANTCKRFCDSYSITKKVQITTERVIYSPSPDEAIYREMDQKVQIYEEFEVDEHIGIQLIIQLPIECKYRAHVEVFGFPSVSNAELYEGFPVYSSLAGSKYFRYIRDAYSSLSELRPYNITLVEIKDGKTPQKIYEEDLVYKAAASLYDFILFDTAIEKVEGQDPILDNLFNSFKTYLQQHHYL